MPILLAFTPPAIVRPQESLSDRCDRALWNALTAIGELTKLANEATNTNEAFRVDAQANALVEAAIGAVGVALDRAERLGDRP